MRPRLLLWPKPINILLIAIGALALGFRAADNIAPTASPATIVMPGSTKTEVSVRTVKRIVKGRVVYRDQKVYVRVPLVVVHTDHHTIKVPAHLLPIRSAAAIVASPLVTVYIPVASTVFVPTTETVFSTVTTTETVIVPTTITLPLTESGGPDQ